MISTCHPEFIAGSQELDCHAFYRIIRDGIGVTSECHHTGWIRLRSHGALPKILLAMTATCHAELVSASLLDVDCQLCHEIPKHGGQSDVQNDMKMLYGRLKSTLLYTAWMISELYRVIVRNFPVITINKHRAICSIAYTCPACIIRMTVSIKHGSIVFNCVTCKFSITAWKYRN